MAGYNGFSMSNNAVAAYESGEKPISKWTKTDIIEAIEDAIRDEELVLNCSMEVKRKQLQMDSNSLRKLVKEIYYVFCK